MRAVIYCCTVCGHAVDERQMSPGRGCFGYGDEHHARAERMRVELPGISCDDGAHTVCARDGCSCPCHKTWRGPRRAVAPRAA